MESLSESMRAVMRISSPPPAPIPTAKDIMVSSGLIVFRPEQRLSDVIKAMVHHNISGAPVVEDNMRLVGIISEFDCLRVVSAGAYEGTPLDGNRTVKELMTTDVTTVTADLNLYGIAHTFITRGLRRVPVVEGQRVLGQVSRRDVLRAVQKLV